MREWYTSLWFCMAFIGKMCYTLNYRKNSILGKNNHKKWKIKEMREITDGRVFNEAPSRLCI